MNGNKIDPQKFPTTFPVRDSLRLNYPQPGLQFGHAVCICGLVAFPLALRIPECHLLPVNHGQMSPCHFESFSVR